MFTPPTSSFFLFGPRGTGKTMWLRHLYKSAPYFDLLESQIMNPLRAQPSRLWDMIPTDYTGPVVIDEIQKLPDLLNEIQSKMNKDRDKYQFVLTGSSARKLRVAGANLLAGRARIRHFHPFLSLELGTLFDLKKAIAFGMLPEAWMVADPKDYLESYLNVYVDQEVRLEGLVRNISDFSRFLEGASLSQASLLNISSVAADSHVSRKTAEGYFGILEDLLIAHRLPVFQKKAKRELVRHKKFYLFDVGLFQTIRPRGILDSDAEVSGAAAETLVLQHLLGLNDLLSLGFDLCFWRTKNGLEVDFVLYGERGLFAIEVKAGSRVRESDLQGLLEFKKDYPQAKCYVISSENRSEIYKGIEFLSFKVFFSELQKLFINNNPRR